MSSSTDIEMYHCFPFSGVMIQRSLGNSFMVHQNLFAVYIDDYFLPVSLRCLVFSYFVQPGVSMISLLDAKTYVESLFYSVIS